MAGRTARVPARSSRRSRSAGSRLAARGDVAGAGRDDVEGADGPEQLAFRARLRGQRQVQAADLLGARPGTSQFVRGRALHSLDRREDALAAYAAALAVDENDAWSLNNTGLIYRGRGELLQARAAHEEALDLVVETIEALLKERGEGEKVWGSMVKQTLKRRKPGFDETYHGFRTFGELLEEAQQRGLLTLQLDEKSGGYIIKELTGED